MHGMRRFIDIINHHWLSMGDAISESFLHTVVPLSDQEIESARLPDTVRDKLFANRQLPDGTMVAVRLNLNAKVGPYWLQTVHRRRATGAVLGYDSAVTVNHAVFQVSQRARELIATRQHNKYPMAAVVGLIVQTAPDLTGLEIRFNPMQGHLFEDLNGHAVMSADQVTVFNTRCYARGQIHYWQQDLAPQPLGHVPTTTGFKARSQI